MIFMRVVGAKLFISYARHDIFHVEIVSGAGRMLYSFLGLNQDIVDLPKSGFAPGVYCVRVESRGMSQSRMFVLAR